jgi:hypothetical protein
MNENQKEDIEATNPNESSDPDYDMFTKTVANDEYYGKLVNKCILTSRK